MRTPYMLAFAAVPLGAMVALSGTAPESLDIQTARAPAGALTDAVAAVRKLASRIPASDPQACSDPPRAGQDNPRLAVGEVLPEGTALHPIPRHESYRYAVVQGQRAIVDAASRQIVYIIQ